MADLALRLKVFVASPSDVLPERDLVEEELRELQREYAGDGLLIDSYRWERQVTPTLRPVQPGINIHLRSAELTILILWSTLGTAARLGETGSMEELRIAGERVVRGYADDVFIYLKSAPPPAMANAEHVRDAQRFKEAVLTSSEVFAVQFSEINEFRARLSRDLRLWMRRWTGVREICSYALLNGGGPSIPQGMLGESRLARLKLQFDPATSPIVGRELGNAAVALYQEFGPSAAAHPLPCAAAPTPGRRWSAAADDGELQQLLQKHVLGVRAGSVQFNDTEWFYFYCALGLVEAISRRDVQAVERRPYVNAVHQYLQSLAIGGTRASLVAVLRDWLLSADGSTEGKPVVRNFAAYVLGMLNAIEAHEDLARAILEDPGEDVRTYCVASLGRMRARVQLPFLKELFVRLDDPAERMMVAQAVSRIVGVADYPL